jgi:hypothetical protein
MPLARRCTLPYFGVSAEAPAVSHMLGLVPGSFGSARTAPAHLEELAQLSAESPAMSYGRAPHVGADQTESAAVDILTGFGPSPKCSRGRGQS